MAWLIFQISLRAILCKGIADTVSQFDDFLQNSPVRILSDTFHNGQGCTAEIEILPMGSSEDILDCKLVIDTENNRYFSKGSIYTSDIEKTFSAYIDEKGVAVSTDALNNVYYGINFDSFLQDIQKIPMLNWIVKDSIAEKWNSELQIARKKIKEGVSVPTVEKVSELMELDIYTPLMIMPARISSTRLSQRNNDIPAIRVTYAFNKEGLSLLFSEGAQYFSSNCDITASFYITNKGLVMCEIQTQEKEIMRKLLIERETISNELLRIQYMERFDNNVQEMTVCFEKQNDGHRERWTTKQETEEEMELCIVWNPASGEMLLLDDEESITVAFRELENGFFLETNDLKRLMKIAGIQLFSTDESQLECKLSISEGGSVDTPEFKNLDQWSIEDFLILLDEIGPFIGWRIF